METLRSELAERDALLDSYQAALASMVELETAEAFIVELESFGGCNDPNASNYDADALYDDGSCEYLGCTDPSAFNYNPAARIDNGSCEYVFGFTVIAENAQGYPEYTEDETGIVFVLLPGGEFEMGSHDGESFDEQPRHKVTLSPFLIANYEVTQAEYEAVMTGSTAGLSATPSSNSGNPEYPVEQVSWYDLKAAAGFLERTGLSLPSEAQWEYACRAGQPGPFSGTGNLDDMGWHRGNDGRSTHPVGRKQANQFGLHDMHGNVAERCEDVYDPNFYSSEGAGGPDPVSTSGTVYRVLRGGRFTLPSGFCRSAFRSLLRPSYRGYVYGFRPVRPLP